MNINLSVNYRTIAFFGAIITALLLSSLYNVFPLPHEYSKQYFSQFVLVLLLLIGYFICRKESSVISFPDYIVLAVSVVGFCSLYALFKDTPFGLWGMQGDAGFNIAIITKFKYYNSWVDFNYKDLSCSYPSIYFYILAKYAAITNTSSLYVLKTGFLTLFILMPWVSYNYLKSIFNTYPAAISVAIFCLFFVDFAIYKPAEFFSLLIFIPWFLGLFRADSNNNKTLIKNGIIGGLIFATYYFWFLIIPFAIISYYLIEKKYAPLIYVFKVLVVSAIVSSFFWLPVFIDCVKYGFHSQISLWFDDSMLVLYRSLDKISILQIIVIAGIIAIVVITEIKAELKWLLLAFVMWLLMGQLSMLIEKPMVHSKMNHFGDFIMILAFAEALILLTEKMVFNIRLLAVISAITVTAGTQTVLDLRANPAYKAAFLNYPSPEWQFSENTINTYKGKVFLTEKILLNEMLPVYNFLNANAHFSHPASQYLKRIDFLSKLQNCNDPAVVLWLLKYNKFCSVDYVWPNANNQVTAYKDNFPYNHVAVPFTFNPQILNAIGVPVNDIHSPFFTGTLYKLNDVPFEAKNTLNQNYISLINEYSL